MKFNLGEEVKLVDSGEHGKVVGRAEYTDAQPSYFVRYLNAQGRQVKEWWGESDLMSD